jgi:CRISPR-associated protein Cas1
MQIVLDTRGLHFSVRNKCFFIEAESESRIIHPSRVSSILITAPCRISSPAIVMAAECEIPVIICNNYGKPEARIWSPHFINISTLRRKQYQYCMEGRAMQWAELIVLRKIEGQESNLVYMADRKPSLTEDVQKALDEIAYQTYFVATWKSKQEISFKKKLMFLEAFTAGRYWPLIGQKLPVPWRFITRVKRNPSDPFNCSINYLYGMLKNQTETSVLGMGLDPALGIIHRDGYKMPSLVFDLMEPFRPLVDRMLVDEILQDNFGFDILEKTGKEILISKQGRKVLIALFNEWVKSRIKYSGTVTNVQNHILTEARYLKKRIDDLRL